MHGKKVLVIGLGLIGGSIALAIKKEHPSCSILGYDIDQEQANLAKVRGVIDEYVSGIKGQTPQADLIIIAAPILKTEETMDFLMDNCTFKKDAIITDVGSTKQSIMDKSEHFSRDVTFIGGHPLAGSHKSGVSAANQNLFENAFYVLITNDSGNDQKVDILKQWLKGTRATFISMTAAEHDRIVGVISHFPHIIAASLVNLLSETNDERIDMRNLAAGGFRDITRIASASPQMWHDIIIKNRSVLIDLVEKWQSEMESVKSMINNIDSARIYNYFKNAKQYRDELPQRKKGALPPLFDIYIDIPDQPGTIAQVTDIIARAHISITNIRIIEMREDIIGVLQITFRSEKDRKHAIETLEQQNYITYLAE